LQVEKEKIKAEIIAKKEKEAAEHADLMEKIKKDKLVKRAEEEAHKEIHEEEMKKGKSLLVEVN